jgi:hypothetical protein
VRPSPDLQQQPTWIVNHPHFPTRNTQVKYQMHSSRLAIKRFSYHRPPDVPAGNPDALQRKSQRRVSKPDFLRNSRAREKTIMVLDSSTDRPTTKNSIRMNEWKKAPVVKLYIPKTCLNADECSEVWCRGSETPCVRRAKSQNLSGLMSWMNTASHNRSAK